MESIEKNTLVQASASAPSDSVSSSTPPEESEEYKIVTEELAILATELEAKCLEVQSYKENFEVLQSDCAERTSELEKVSSQLQKAKLDGNTAVEKLKKAEEDLAQIKEKNAQLSDELLNKSRQVKVLFFLHYSQIQTLTFCRLLPLKIAEAAVQRQKCNNYNKNVMNCKRKSKLDPQVFHLVRLFKTL